MSGSRTAIGMSVTAAGGENVSLEAGTHRYPFMFFLPPTVPSSFEGEVGHVRYTVEATMERPRWRSNRVTRSAFTVISVVDLNLQPTTWVQGNSNCVESDVKCYYTILMLPEAADLAQNCYLWRMLLEHQTRLCALSSVISRPTCFSSSLRCCWLVAQHRSSGAAVTV